MVQRRSMSSTARSKDNPDHLLSKGARRDGEVYKSAVRPSIDGVILAVPRRAGVSRAHWAPSKPFVAGHLIETALGGRDATLQAYTGFCG
jgi:hypothetical protein